MPSKWDCKKPWSWKKERLPVQLRSFENKNKFIKFYVKPISQWFCDVHTNIMLIDPQSTKARPICEVCLRISLEKANNKEKEYWGVGTPTGLLFKRTSELLCTLQTHSTSDLTPSKRLEKQVLGGKYG